MFTEGISPLISGSVCLSLGCSFANPPYPAVSREVSSCAASASLRLLPSLFLALTPLAQSMFSLLVSVLLVLELHSSSAVSPAFCLFCLLHLHVCQFVKRKILEFHLKFNGFIYFILFFLHFGLTFE